MSYAVSTRPYFDIKEIVFKHELQARASGESINLQVCGKSSQAYCCRNARKDQFRKV